MARTRYQDGSSQLQLRELPFAALRATLREGYDRSALQQDVLAGLKADGRFSFLEGGLQTPELNAKFRR